MDDRRKALPVDDVYPGRYYQWRCFSFEEAIECHRETHHPSMYNQPTAPLMAMLDLDMRLEKEVLYMSLVY
jgi:large subunit ribosomal protein L1